MKENISPEITIVLVEDDPGHALLIKKNLLRAGIINEIIHLDNGKKAIDFIFREIAEEKVGIQLPHYLILLDLNLPIVDGYQVLETLKTDARTRHIPVIMMTTTGNDIEVRRCYESGCNMYLVKPVKYEKFAEAIQKLGLLLAFINTPESGQLRIEAKL